MRKRDYFDWLEQTTGAEVSRFFADSERELAAATQRRDSINQQLVNVRQMLATLSGTAGFTDPLVEHPAPPAASEPAPAVRDWDGG